MAVAGNAASVVADVDAAAAAVADAVLDAACRDSADAQTPADFDSVHSCAGA